MTERKNNVSQEMNVDEELLRDFFARSRCMHVADDGFTARVMEQIPETLPWGQRLICRLWAAACVVVSIVVFFANDGIALVKQSLGSAFCNAAATASQYAAQINLSQWLHAAAPSGSIYTLPLIAVGVLTVVGVLSLYGVAESE